MISQFDQLNAKHNCCLFVEHEVESKANSTLWHQGDKADLDFIESMLDIHRGSSLLSGESTCHVSCPCLLSRLSLKEIICT